jgi:DNA-binding response OmpR family regulator
MGARTVLLVDDDRDFTDTLAMLFEAEGFDVLTAPDGRSALEVAHEVRPPVILLDLAMPGEDGYKVLASMRTEGGCGESAVFAVSGWGTESTENSCVAAGFDGYFRKPFEPASLMRRVAEAIYRRCVQDDERRRHESLRPGKTRPVEHPSQD